MEDGFSSWARLGEYLTPFTDVVIVDGYIFSDSSLVPSNLEQIIVELDKATPVKFNLTILSFAGEGIKKIDGQTEYDNLQALKQRLNLKCDIELIFTPREMKEHDRHIITNYIRIKSGDSFNYFNSKGEVITKGTEISMGSMVNEVEREVGMVTLREVARKVDEIKDKHPDRFFGGCKNQLLVKAKEYIV